MTERIKQFIDSNNLLTKNAKVVVGVSGGADSVALVCILQQAGYSCIIAHVNFNLRGNESEHDENFTRELVLKLQLPFFKPRSIQLKLPTRGQFPLKWPPANFVTHGSTNYYSKPMPKQLP